MSMALLLAFLACEDQNNSGFTSGGTSSVDPSSVLNSSSSTDSSTDSTDSSDDTASSGGSAPEIVSLDAFFTDRDGTYLVEVHVGYVDEDDDMIDGAVIMMYEESPTEINYEESNINGTSVIVEDGELSLFNSLVLDPSQSYEFDVMIKDAAGNESEWSSVTVDPVQE